MKSAELLRVHVLFEYSADGLPHGCSLIRLLRPLSHPAIKSRLSLTYGVLLPSHSIDILIIERLWDHTCDWDSHRTMLKTIKEMGTKLIFEIDDNLLDVNTEVGSRDWPSTKQKMWLRQLIRFADGVIVSTPHLASRIASLNPRVEIIENALDERLFERSCDFNYKENNGVVVFGYMGTFSHLDDLLSIIQPLRKVLALYGDRVRFEIVGIGDASVLKAVFAGLPVRFLSVPAHAVSYEHFTAWMQDTIRWDFGIAPLISSTFTRSKSDIKFLDYGIQGIPSIFSDVPAYNETVIHFENGILATDAQSWEIWLERMLVDGKLRKKLAENAHAYVIGERTLRNSASHWWNALDKFMIPVGTD